MRPPEPEVYLQVKPLPPACRPAWVVREDGATLLTVDPRSTCAEVVQYSVDALTVEELNAYRAAYGEPPVGEPLSDPWLSDKPFPIWVPPEVGGWDWQQKTA